MSCDSTLLFSTDELTPLIINFLSRFSHFLLRSGSVQHYWNEIFYFVDHLAHKFIRYVHT